ncbi:hypothetical protein AB1Y20_002744 [Prymnesium parvum]|uniref:Glycosyl transferase CAP10 domain-containing protein n=1 Tax=Prymnesium parvum TaxID=97485 RepID=A0AB34JCH4_PRYPA
MAPREATPCWRLCASFALLLLTSTLACWLWQLPETPEQLVRLPLLPPLPPTREGARRARAPPPPPLHLAPLPSCAELDAWDDSHFSAEQDWVPMADGAAVEPATLWRWDGEARGHLRNERSGGHLNARPEGYVRGHGNPPQHAGRAAPRAASTELLRTEVELDRYAPRRRECRAGRTVSLKFVKSGYVHVTQDGVIWARMNECSDDPACLFDIEPHANGLISLRSRLTGRLLRMVDSTHPPFRGWGGVTAPAARLKPPRRLRREERRAANALSAAARCPVRPSAAAAPAGWAYNASSFAALVRRSLAPWHGGGLSATAVDVAYWREMFPYENRYERPTLHISIWEGSVYYKWQPPPDDAPSAAGRATPPAASSDRTLLQMLSRLAQIVSLPDVEFVAHTASLPKVAAQNPELVVSPSSDAAHTDIPIPSPSLYTSLLSPRAALGAAAVRGGVCPPLATRTPRLLLLAACDGPPDGHRAPLWRYYAVHRAALLSRALPRLMRVELRGACLAAGEGRLPLEEAWAEKALREMRAELGEPALRVARREAAEGVPRGRVVVNAAALCAADAHACDYQWILQLDGAGPPPRFAQRLAQGFVVFKQESPYYEYFYSLLQPWEHYIPVSDSLHDLPARLIWARDHPAEAHAIAARAQLAVARLHLHDAACFWWQLLSAMAPLQTHEPRHSANGFRLFSEGETARRS